VRAGGIAQAASRRLSRPLMRFRGAPGISDLEGQDGYWFPPDPCGVSTPLGCSPSEPSARPKPNGDPPCTSAPLQRHAPTAPRRSVVSAGRSRQTDPSCDAASPGLPCPTTQSRTGGVA
jgi:hypothetical protein